MTILASNLGKIAVIAKVKFAQKPLTQKPFDVRECTIGVVVGTKPLVCQLSADHSTPVRLKSCTEDDILPAQSGHLREAQPGLNSEQKEGVVPAPTQLR